MKQPCIPDTPHHIIHSNPVGISFECQHFISLYQSLNKDNLANLVDLYHPNITFIDPLHKITGLTELRAYFLESYGGVNSIKFTIHKVMEDDNEASIFWTMSFSSRKLNHGNIIHVDGISLIQFQNPLSNNKSFSQSSKTDNKILFHRDYYDAGQMLYEHIPLMGRVIAYIKKRLGSK